MKKSNYGALLCIFGSVTAALWVHGGMWRYLHWPGGYAQLITAACATIILGCVLAVWLSKSDVFDSIISTKGRSALHLRNSLICLSLVSGIFSLGVIFRLMHWPYGAQLIIWPCAIIAILFILIGVLGSKLAKK